MVVEKQRVLKCDKDDASELIRETSQHPMQGQPLTCDRDGTVTIITMIISRSYNGQLTIAVLTMVISRSYNVQLTIAILTKS